MFGLLAILSFKTLVLALPVWAAVRLLRPIRPALEHGIWTAVLAGMLLLPLTSLIGLLPASEQFTLQTEALRLESLGAVGGHSVPDAVRSAQGSWQSWGGLVYLLVLGFFAGRLILGYWRAARLVSRASEIGDEEARGIFDAMIVSLHLTRKVTLLSSFRDTDACHLRLPPTRRHSSRHLARVALRETAGRCWFTNFRTLHAATPGLPLPPP